jgi:hypothetical protein
MEVAATNDGSGITTLAVAMGPLGEDWYAEETIDVRTDDLPRVAEAMKNFLGVDQGSRFQPVDDS